ncbi:MAG: hypothetical protein HEEMFOPI_00486 [Holosporales bacterium]
MKNKDLISYLQIIRCPKVGPKTFFKLFNQFDEDPTLILKFLKNNGFNIPPEKEVNKEIETLLKLKGSLLFFKNDGYPQYLKSIENPPPFLTILGNANALKKESISIIGARNASLIGQRFIARIANFFSEKGYSIVSGLARGIDTAAHKASIDFGTIAVLSGGVDQVYPQENKALFESIQENGVILSEMPLGTIPSAQLFARRNRIISGLSRAIIISEAAKHSGSMITADFALSQGREVFVVPSHPSDPRSEGGNWLIQQGAHLFQKEQDVLDILNTLPKITSTASVITQAPSVKRSISLHPLENEEETKKQNGQEEQEEQNLANKILNLLTDIPIEMEDLFNSFPQTNITDLMVTISDLHLKGLVIIHPNQTVSIFLEKK